MAQFSRVLSTLLIGGIPLVQALETSGRSLGTVLLKKALDQTAGTGAGRAARFPLAEHHRHFSGARDRHDRSGRIHRRAAPDAEQRGGVLRRGCDTRMTAVLSLIEPAIMIFMGIFVAFVLVALYLPIFSLAGHDSVNSYGDRNNQIQRSGCRKHAQARSAGARATAASSSICEKRRIDHDLFRSVPVDLMFRYNSCRCRRRTGRSRSRCPIRGNLNLIDELALLLDKKLRVKVATLLADLRSAEEDRAIAARARRSHRRLHAGRGRRRRGRSDETLSIDKLTADDSEHRAGHQAGGYHHLQRARTARERYSHRNARPGSGHQVPHRRRAALRHAARSRRTGIRPSFRASR